MEPTPLFVIPYLEWPFTVPPHPDMYALIAAIGIVTFFIGAQYQRVVSGARRKRQERREAKEAARERPWDITEPTWEEKGEEDPLSTVDYEDYDDQEWEDADLTEDAVEEDEEHDLDDESDPDPEPDPEPEPTPSKRKKRRKDPTPAVADEEPKRKKRRRRGDSEPEPEPEPEEEEEDEDDEEEEDIVIPKAKAARKRAQSRSSAADDEEWEDEDWEDDWEDEEEDEDDPFTQVTKVEQKRGYSDVEGEAARLLLENFL